MAYEEMPVACPTRAVLIEHIHDRRDKWVARGSKEHDILAIGGLFQFGVVENSDERSLEHAFDFWGTYYANCCRCGGSCHDRDPMRVITPPCGHFHCALHEGRGHQCTAWRCEYEDDPL